MTDAQLELLARVAADMPLRAAADYVKLGGFTVQDYALAMQALRAEVTIAIGPALSEARAALAAGQDHVAEARFKASMMAAGLKAAKEFTSA